MEAIGELFLAIAGALVELLGALLELLFGLIQVVAYLLTIVLEFVFLALTQGISAASQQYKKRKLERAVQLTTAKVTTVTWTLDEIPPVNLKRIGILVSIVFFVMVCCIVTWSVRDQIKKQRVADTRSQIKKLADTFAQLIKDKKIAAPVPGRLQDLDAWQQPIELFVDKGLFGSMVIVRSWGPDQKPGSIDDILSKRMIRAPAKDVGGEIAKRGVKAIRKRVAGLLPGGDKEKQPEKTDNAEK